MSQTPRRDKVEDLRAKGVDPFPPSHIIDRDPISKIFKSRPGPIFHGRHEKSHYHIAGRVIAQRGHGKAIFFDVRDMSGMIQVYARADELDEIAFEQIDNLDIGDIVSVRGPLYVTKRGQVSIAVDQCVLLSKSLNDPPDLFHGITDSEVRSRKRELDLLVNEKARNTFLLRSRVVAECRKYMYEHDFTEVETPILQPLIGGASARPFVTHHNSLDRKLYLRTSTELYLKRAIVGGLENVYELSRFFRNEGISPQHNPEFTMLEYFVSYADYIGVMEYAERMISTVVQRVLGTTKVQRNGEIIDFAMPWQSFTLRNAIIHYTGRDIFNTDLAELADLVDESPDADWTTVVDSLQGKYVEPHLTQPTFLIDLPLDLWPLVKPVLGFPVLGQAFDCIIGGIEIVGGGTDVNDPDMQREHFIRQRERQESGNERNPQPMDEEFVEALEYGMMPASGAGIGIDRLVMLLAEAENLREVILFPTMKSKLQE